MLILFIFLFDSLLDINIVIYEMIVVSTSINTGTFILNLGLLIISFITADVISYA